MRKEIVHVRPAIISAKIGELLDERRRFRHVVRNVYTHHLDPKRLEKLVKETSQEFPRWEESYGFIAVATCILLVQAFIEKNLKLILYSLAGGSKKYQQVAGESKIGSYLRNLMVRGISRSRRVVSIY